MLLFDFAVTSFIFVTIEIKIVERTTACFIVFVFVCVWAMKRSYVSYVEGRNECKQKKMAKRFATSNAEDISDLEGKAKNVNTSTSTKTWVNTFKSWATSRDILPELFVAFLIFKGIRLTRNRIRARAIWD